MGYFRYQTPKLNASTSWQEILITARKVLVLKVHLESLTEKISPKAGSMVQDAANHLWKRKQNALGRQSRMFWAGKPAILLSTCFWMPACAVSGTNPANILTVHCVLSHINGFKHL